MCFLTMNAHEWIAHEDEVSAEARIERLDWLIDHTSSGENWLLRGGQLAWQLFEETRCCFVYGQDLACVLLSLAFIEVSLAAQFYAAGRDEFERASIKEILEEARKALWISDAEFELFDKIRKLRNPVAHFRSPGHPEGLVGRSFKDGVSEAQIMESDAKLAISAIFHIILKYDSEQRS